MTKSIGDNINIKEKNSTGSPYRFTISCYDSIKIFT